MKVLSLIGGVALASASMTSVASPTIDPFQLTVDENTKNGTLLGQVIARNGLPSHQIQLEVGELSTSNWKTAGDAYESVSFNTAFSQAPIVFSQVQSYGNYTVPYYWDTYSSKGWQYKEGYEVLVRTRQQNTTSTGFETVIETDLRVGGGSVVEQIGNRGNETIGWMAISEASDGVWSDLPFESKLTPEEVTQNNKTYSFNGPFYSSPNFIGSVATTNGTDRVGLDIDNVGAGSVRVRMDEFDDSDHAAEAVSMLALQGDGPLYDANGVIIGEVGSLSTSDDSRANAHTINFSHTFADPIVFLNVRTVTDSTWRFTNISNNRFSGYLHDEREHLFPKANGDIHLSYVVVEKGSWTVNLQRYSYAITAGNESGAFSIDAETGQIKVADSSQLDFESGTTEYNLTVQVTDGTGATGTTQVDFDIRDVSDSLNTDAHILLGSNGDDQLGWATSPGGDINGDGYDDFIVAAHSHDVNGANSGRVYVVFGDGAGVLPSITDIESGSGGFVINGESAGDKAGFAVAGGGDVNGDGLADIAIGAPYADPNGADSGKAYIVFGKADTSAVELSAIAADNHAGGFVMNGITRRDDVGGSIVLGDVNGDRLADIVIGEIHRVSAGNDGFGISSTKYTDLNYAYTVFGKSDGTSVDLSALATDSNATGYAIDASNRKKSENSYLGSTVVPVGDFNSDGRDDYLINKTIYSGTNNFLVFGRVEGTSIAYNDISNADHGITIVSETGSYGVDNSLKFSLIPAFGSGRAGDINGDGIDDLVLLLADTDCCSGISYPRAYVVFGVSGIETNINLSDIAQGIGGFIIENDAPQVDRGSSNMAFGAISGAGDINGDGYDDLMIGDMYANAANGRAYIVYGKADTSAVSLNDVYNNIGGYFAVGAGGERLGHWVSQAGDVNGDGITDMLFGAHLSDPVGGTNAGKTYVFISKGEAITQWGSDVDDVLNLASFAQKSNVSAKTGNDVITKSIFADVIFAGPGNDTIILNDTNISRIDGGQGTDEIVLTGANQTLNIANRAALVRSVEVFDINGSGANTLAFNKNVSGNQTVTIKGGADDKVISTNQTWLETAQTETIEGIDYKVYTSGAAKMYLQVGMGITVNESPTVDAATFSIDEYSVGGTPIGTVQADPKDAGDSVQFAITAGNELGFFAIDSATGLISLDENLGQLDYESGASYVLTIKVIDDFGASDTADVTINVNDFGNLSYSMNMEAGGSASIWGDDFLIDLFSREIQEGEEVSTNLPGSVDLPMFRINASGQVGMKTEFGTNGGSVNATLPMTYSVSFPDEVKAGVPFELDSNLIVDNGASVDVSSPEFSLKGTAWLKNYSLGVEAKFPNVLDDLSFVDTNMSGSYAEEVLEIASDSESRNANQNAQDPYLFEAVIDLPEWVNQSLDMPDKWGYLQKSTSGSGDRCIEDFFGYAGEDLSARWEYFLFDQSLMATAALYQDFRVQLQPTATITFENGTVLPFDPTDKALITPLASYDKNSDGVIDATIEVRPNPMFRNDSSLTATMNMPLKAVYMNYNIQEALCGFQTYLFQQDGLVYERASAGPLIDTNLFEARISSSPFGGQTDFIEDVIEFNLNDSAYTQQVSFDLCDGSGTACAAPVINDSDEDGMSDEWETLYNLDPNDPNDADLDGDSDNFTNREEYEAGSDPTDINDVPVYAPVAIVVNQSILETPGAQTVQLDASQSENADSYQWTQVSGPQVSLIDADTATPSFVLPSLNGADSFVFELIVSNSKGSDSAELSISVDLAPIANAGPDQPSGNLVIQPGELVNLNASNSSDDRFAAASLIYSWQETSATGAMLSDANSATPSFYAPYISANGGAVTFEVSVSDGLNEASNDSVIINIDAGAPSADAGPDVSGINDGELVCLDASNSADRGTGTIATYLWTQRFGETVTLDDVNASQACFNWPQSAATIGFDLEVSDNDGLMASDSVLLSGANVVVPECHAGTDRVYPEGETVTLDGALSSIASGSMDYFWVQESGSAVTIFDPSAQSTIFGAPQVSASGESLSFTLRCTSDLGVVSQDEVMFTIGDGAAPVANAGNDQSVRELEQVCLNANASNDPEGDALLFKWSQIASNTGETVSFDDPMAEEACFIAPATDDANGLSFTFQLEVTEENGALSDTDEVIVNVSRINQAPILSPIADIAGTEGEQVTLTVSASDADGDALTYAWRQDSGSQGQFVEADQASVMFTLPYVGVSGEVIELTVTVSDGDLTNSWTFSAAVSDGATAPIVRAALDEAPQQTVIVETQVSTEEQVIHRFVLSADQGGSELYEVTIAIDGDVQELEDLSVLRIYYDSNQDGVVGDDEPLLYQGEQSLSADALTLSLLRAQALAEGDNHFLVTAEVSLISTNQSTATQ